MNKAILLLLSVLLLSACAPKNIYDAEGNVAIINIDEKYITIDHTKIPDVMPAMRMSYAINDDNLDQIKSIKEGDNVSITIKSDERKLNFELIKIIKK